MSDESKLDGQPPEAGPEDGQPVEGAAQTDATYDGPIEKLKGKTLSEIAEVYGGLESLTGKKDGEIKSQAEKLQSYEQWYKSQQAQQQQQQQPPQQQQPTAPPDIYDNPVGFVSHTVQPQIQQAVEGVKLQNAVQFAPMVMSQAKANYPEIFDGVDEQELMGIMMSGVKTNTVHYSALTDQNAFKMAAWQMKGEKSDYKPAGPQPMETTQTEQPSGGSSEGESPSIPRDLKEQAEAMGKDDKTAQKIWDRTLKEREAK